MTRILSEFHNPNGQPLQPALPGFPISDDLAAFRRWTIVEREKCPECGHELDTGWECTNCFHDGRAEARSTIDTAITAEQNESEEP